MIATTFELQSVPGDAVRPTTEQLDRRDSDEKSQAVPWAAAETRLTAAQIAWIVTVRPDGRPHATPMVPVVPDGKVYFHTGSTELYRERRDGRWQLDVRDGGLAAHVPGAGPVMFEVTPDRAYGHAKGDPFGQTNYRY